MHDDELVDRLETGTTRRTVVRSGVKLAYAAPLVAASFKLGTHGVAAQAVSPRECETGGLCGQPVDCRGGCFCNSDLDNVIHCGADVGCDNPCTSNAECEAIFGAGAFCQGGDFAACCGPNICVPPCGIAVSLGDGPSNNG
jgi:hypothetical protein